MNKANKINIVKSNNSSNSSKKKIQRSKKRGINQFKNKKEKLDDSISSTNTSTGSNASKLDKSLSNRSKEDEKEEGEESDESDDAGSSIHEKSQDELSSESSNESLLDDFGPKNKKRLKTITDTASTKRNDAEDGELDSDEMDKISKSPKANLNNNNNGAEEDVNNTVTRAKKLNKLIDRFKKELKECDHKLNKIYRAFKKSQAQNNKIKLKKCEKYMLKYERKMQKLKKNIEICRGKLNDLNKYTSNSTCANSNQKSNNEISNLNQNEINNKRKRIDESSNEKRNSISPNSSKKRSINDDTSSSGQKSSIAAKQHQTSIQPAAQQQQQSPVIKLPYPVLNDKREMNTILSTLETKRLELFKKRDLNRKNIETLNQSLDRINTQSLLFEKQHRSIEKLKQMEQLFESQQEKLQKQIDYIKLCMQIDQIRHAQLVGSGPTSGSNLMIQNLSAQLNDMYLFMKSENNSYLKKYHLDQSLSSDQSSKPPNLNKTVADSTKQLSKTVLEPPINKIKSLYESVNNSLAALIAHTAACAHSAAAISIYNYQYYYYYQQQQQQTSKTDNNDKTVYDLQASLSNQQQLPLVPLKDEIVKASSSFAKFKDKISCFFMNTKNSESILPKKKDIKENSTIKKLVADYSEDEDDQAQLIESDQDEADKNSIKENDQIKIINLIKNLKKSNEIISNDSDFENKSTINSKGKINDDDNDNDTDQDNEDEDNCDLEIVTTSEIKSNMSSNKRNYLLPSLKASYFPLKASLIEFNNDYNYNSINNSRFKKMKLSDILFGEKLTAQNRN